MGILVFFMGPNNTTWHWGVNNVAALVLAGVGALHTFHIIREGGGGGVGGAPLAAGMAPSDGLDFARPLPQAQAGAQQQWAKMVDQSESL